MKKFKCAISMVLCLLMCMSLLAGCGGNTEPPANNPPAGPTNPPSGTDPVVPPAADPVKYVDDLTVILDNNKLASIDIHNPAANLLPARWVFTLMYGTLVRLVDGEYLPWLATKWETTAWQNFTFTLRDDVVFHNGEKLTAEDVVYTLTRAQSATGTQAFDNTKNIESMTAVDEHTVQFKTKNVDVDFLQELSNVYTSILNKKAVEADPEKGVYVGTGLWMLKDFSPNDYVKFDANPNFWGETTPTKTLTLKYVAEPSARLIQLENGEVQGCFQLSAKDYDYVAADSRFAISTVTVNSSQYLAFNMNDPICSDLNFRKAVASCLNRPDMIQVSQGGYGVAPTGGSFWGMSTQYRDNSIPLLPLDLDAAKKFLADSSYKGQEIEIVAANADIILMAQVIQANLKAAGINAKIFQTDASGLAAYSKYEGNKAQITCYVGPFTNAASSAKSFYYPGSAANRASYNNPEVSKLFDQAATTVDAAQREQLYKQIQQLVAADMPYIYLINRTTVFTALAGVEGVRLSTDATHDLSYIKMAAK